jgi:hypothetical protein
MADYLCHLHQVWNAWTAGFCSGWAGGCPAEQRLLGVGQSAMDGWYYLEARFYNHKD